MSNDRYWKIGQKITIFNSYVFERINFKDLEGGFGSVFPVVEPNNNLIMAVKVAKYYTNQGYHESIKKEARILLMLPPHPNIVESCIVEKIYGKYHIFMEWLDDGNLAELIDNIDYAESENKYMEWLNLYSFVYQIIQGMKFLHSHGILHKDLKPSNILIKKIKNDEGSVYLVLKIADFGISSMIKTKDEMMAIDSLDTKKDHNLFNIITNIAFTHGYASPEQEGFIFDKTIDERTDIFSFGIVILELITGQLRFKQIVNYYQDFFAYEDKALDEMTVSHIDFKLQSKIDGFIDKYRKDTPFAIRKIIKACLRVNPKDRYQSFDEIERQIEIPISCIYDSDINNSFLKTANNIQNHSPSFSSILFYSLRGFSLDFLGYQEDGKDSFEKVIEFECNNIKDYSNKGISLRHLGRYDKAIVEYDKAIELDPYDASSHNGKGNTYFDLGRYDKAIVEYDKAIELDPAYTPALKNKAIALRRLNYNSRPFYKKTGWYTVFEFIREQLRE